MRLFRLLPLLALLLAAFAAASCGGGASSPTDGSQKAGLSPSDWAAMNHGSAPPSSSGLPSFPYDNSGVRSASDAGGTVLGANFLLSDRCVVEGDSLHINVAGDNPGMGGEDMGWAMYRISGLSGQRALSLNVECLPDSLGNQYYVGVANYTHLSWDWYGPVEIPEAQIDLAQDNAAYISNLGNLYFVIACYGGSSATHSQSTVVTGNGGGGLPGAPAGLFASKGEFPDGVQLTWGPGVNAAWYEVERRDPNGDANNGMPGGQWMQIGIAQDSSWFDPNLPAGVMFEYRVRSVNAAGVSDYSNTDFGFAYGGPPPGGDYALQGTVYAVGGNNDPMLGQAYPLPGALISVVSADGAVAATAQSDESGFYFVPSLPGGEYIATVELPGWTFEPAQAFFVIGPDSPNAWIDFLGRMDGGGGGGSDLGIHGNVYGYDGQIDPNGGGVIPLEGATLTVFDANTNVVIMTASSDAQGWYQIQQLPAGTYTIGCEKEGWLFWEQFFTFTVGETVPDLQFDFYGEAVN